MKALQQAIEESREVGFAALGEGKIHDIAINCDRQWVGVACGSGAVILLDRTGTVRQQWQACEGGETRAVAFSPQGQQLVTGGSDGRIRLWTLDGTAVEQPFSGHEGAILSVAFSPLGDRIASTGTDLVVQMWTLDGQPMPRPLPGDRSLIRQVCFDPLGRWLLGAGGNGKLYLWNWREQRLDRAIDTQMDALLTVGMDAKGDWVVGGSWDGQVFLWSVAQDSGISWAAHPGPIAAVVAGERGTICSAGSEPGVKQWSANGDIQRWLWGTSSDNTTAAAIAADGGWMASGTTSGEVQLWDLREMSQLLAERGSGQGRDDLEGSLVRGQGNDRASLKDDCQLWLELACERIQYHLASDSPCSPEAQSVSKICQVYGRDGALPLDARNRHRH